MVETNEEATMAAEPAPQSVEKPACWGLAGVVISRGIIAAGLAAVHEPIITGLLVMLALAGIVMACVRWLFGPPAAMNEHLAKAAIYGLAAVLGSGASARDAQDVSVVVAKIAEYRQKHGEYPERLEAMVPELLPAIPRIGLIPFIYERQPGSYVLTYRPSAMGPCSYRPEAGNWKCQAN